MQVPCTQCGGSVQLEEGARFATCRFCGSALYVDKTKVVFHFVVTPTISAEEAQGKLRRWMAGNETVKDLDINAKVTHQELVFFPMWRFVADQQDGQHEFSELASSFAISEIKSIPLSGGGLKYFAPSEFQGLVLKDPEILLESAMSWLQQRGIDKAAVKETNLIHIPFYYFRYDYKGQTYQTVVDGVSGRVMAAIYPAKAELPFVGIAIAAGIVFFLEGVIAPNFIIRLGLYILTFIPFGLASLAIVKKY